LKVNKLAKECKQDSSKKAFYVLAYTGSVTRGTYYLCDDICATSVLAYAQRFETVNAALRSPLIRKWSGDILRLVRVEEVPGTPRRVVLGETEQAPSRAVEYAVYGENSGGFLNAGGNWFADTDGARLFSTPALAIAELERRAIRNGTGNGPVTIKRIATIPGTPTLTETVLA
jgi:hypothetical protein